METIARFHSWCRAASLVCAWMAFPAPASGGEVSKLGKYSYNAFDFVEVTKADGKLVVNAMHVQTKRYLQKEGYPTAPIPSCAAAVRFTNDKLALQGFSIRVDESSCQCEDTLRGTGRCTIHAETAVPDGQ